MLNSMYYPPAYCFRVGSYRKMILQRKRKKGAEVVKRKVDGGKEEWKESKKKVRMKKINGKRDITGD